MIEGISIPIVAPDRIRNIPAPYNADDDITPTGGVNIEIINSAYPSSIVT